MEGLESHSIHDALSTPVFLPALEGGRAKHEGPRIPFGADLLEGFHLARCPGIAARAATGETLFRIGVGAERKISSTDHKQRHDELVETGHGVLSLAGNDFSFRSVCFNKEEKLKKYSTKLVVNINA